MIKKQKHSIQRVRKVSMTDRDRLSTMPHKNKKKEAKLTFPDEGVDICYDCGAIGVYGTFEGINDFDFDIYCSRCIGKYK
ncbi:MAG: hypothetical protein J7L15_08365 [Clostridiales bacterium]|nr:hypothetical protein [Clostridiales bacterium]